MPHCLRAQIGQLALRMARMMKLRPRLSKSWEENVRMPRAKSNELLTSLLMLNDDKCMKNGLVDGLYCLPEGLSIAVSFGANFGIRCHMDTKNDSMPGRSITGVISWCGDIENIGMLRMSIIGYTRSDMGLRERRVLSHGVLEGTRHVQKKRRINVQKKRRINVQKKRRIKQTRK